MANENETNANPFNFLIDSFWASLPEKTADELATFKKDVLLAVRDTVDQLIDTELAWTDRHLENARKMREEYRRREAQPGAAPDAA
ncbi:MAG: hypothetical protein SF339_07885 [Blastocatellia bacterium]|jgi:hypothetical protein|nr:hypothetical protein [Blastocatellia bacterium]